MSTVLLVNGPSLNLLGIHDPKIYGSTGFKEIEERVFSILSLRKIGYKSFQSNSEEEIIDWLKKQHDAEFLLLNPGILTSKNLGLCEAVLQMELPFLEIHLSNYKKNEEFVSSSNFSDLAKGTIAGLGIKGYSLASQFAADFLEQKKRSETKTGF